MSEVVPVEAHAPPVEQSEAPRPALGVVAEVAQAADKLRDARDEHADAVVAAEPLPTIQPAPVVPSVEQPQVSPEDFELVQLFGARSEAFQRDLAVYNEVRAMDLGAIERTDRPRAVAIRAQLAEAEKELQERQQTLTAAAHEIQAKLETTERQRAEVLIVTERQKLEKEMPGTDLGVLTDYLTGVFSPEELATAVDHRLFMLAEKARRYDAQEKPRGVKRVKKTGERVTEEQAKADVVDALRARLKETGKVRDAMAVMAAQRRMAE